MNDVCLVFLFKIEQKIIISTKIFTQPVSICFIIFNRHNAHTILASFFFLLITVNRIYSRREFRHVSCVIIETAVYIYTLCWSLAHFKLKAVYQNLMKMIGLMRNHTVFSARFYFNLIIHFPFSFLLFFFYFSIVFSHWMAFLCILNEFRIVVLLFDVFNGKEDEKEKKTHIFR